MHTLWLRYIAQRNIIFYTNQSKDKNHNLEKKIVDYFQNKQLLFEEFVN